MRVKRGPKARQRRNKILKLAEGFRGRSKNTIRQARQRLEKSLCYTYRDRRQRKRQMHGIWIVRLNAAAKLNGISYSRLISALRTSKIDLNRKILADLGALHPEVFTKVKEVAVAQQK